MKKRACYGSKYKYDSDPTLEIPHICNFSDFLDVIIMKIQLKSNIIAAAVKGCQPYGKIRGLTLIAACPGK
jgi:hypothetical protein